MGAPFSPRSWVVLLGAGLCGCIVSVAGLTGGPTDAGAPDSSVDTGGSDVVVDQGPVPEGGADGGNCTDVYAPPDAAPVACPTPGADAGPVGAEAGVACAAMSLSNFQEHFVPPNPPQNVCTTAQIAMVVTCLSTDSPACVAFVDPDAGNKTCIDCMVSPTNAQSYGPVVQDLTNNIDTLNVGGCVALVDPCQVPCAHAATATQQCHFAACASCALSTSTDLQAFDDCTNVADTCACLPEFNAGQACKSRLMTTAASSCYPSQGFTTAAQFYGKVFCGGGP